MFKRLRKAFCAFAVGAYARQASAIDPYTVVKVGVGIAANAGTGGAAGAVLGVAGGLMGGGGGGDVEDFTSIGFAFTELLDDFEVDQSSGDELRTKARELEDLQSKIRGGESEVESTKNAVEELKRAEGTKETLEAVHNMVQRTKLIAKLIPGHPKASQSALQVQSTRLNYMMLDEVSGLRQLELERRVEQQITENQFRLLAKSIESEEKKAVKVRN